MIWHDYMRACDLLRDAMRNVRVVQCTGCGGVGEKLSGPCEECRGCGLTTTTELPSCQEAAEQ